MKFLVVVSCLLAVAFAKPGLVAPVAYNAVVPSSYGYSYSSHVAAAPVAYAAHSVAAPVAYAAHSVVPAPVAYSAHSVVAAPAVHHSVVAAPAVAVEKSQYHAQDTLGQAAYGHSEAFQAHNAVQDAAGNKIGSYSYVAPDGQVIATSYVADALGYRVASNAAPVESAEVVAARAAHLHEVEVVKHRNRRSPVFAAYPYSAYSTPYAYHGVSPVVARTTYATGHVVSAPHAYAAYRYY